VPIFSKVVLTVKEKEYFCSEIRGSLSMISRRLLRIKALLILYAFNRRDDDDLALAEKELLFSINKTYELYHYLLLLVLELAKIASERIDQALRKRVPTQEDLNPVRKFVDNQVVKQLGDNLALNRYISATKISWVNNPHVPRMLYNKMIGWEVYNDYLLSEENSYQSDRKFIIRLITELITGCEDFLTNIEEQSIYWNDDLEYVSAMVEKTLKRFKADSGEKTGLLPMFKNEEDKDFVLHLFRKAVVNSGRCSELIENNTTNWELERIALMDILVMQLAVTEILEFPEIPVKVTLNEYIEIAKYYCTSKSSTFVNGILDNIVREIRKEGLFNKQGRGLVGETVREDV